MNIPLEIVEQTGSTSDELKARAEADGPEVALMARRQTGGRGRLGRSWSSMPGNLHMSVLLRPRPVLSPVVFPGHWSLLAAVAVIGALEPFVPAGLLRLKWPNDVMAPDGKVAGILIEAGGAPRPWLVLGVGINLQSAPRVPGRATACVGPGAPALEEVARAVLTEIATWRARYRQDGFEPVRTAWLARGPEAGAPLMAAAGSGAFEGIGADGALWLRSEGRRMVVSSGEVSPLS